LLSQERRSSNNQVQKQRSIEYRFHWSAPFKIRKFPFITAPRRREALFSTVYQAYLVFAIYHASGYGNRVWPDFLASDFKFVFCNPPTADKIGRFDFAQDKLCLGLNWLCFGFELGLFF
jgi:hypothetical protein